MFKFSNLWKSDGRSVLQATQAATMEAFLPSPDSGLLGEVTLGSLAFVRDQYHRMRASLIEIDASDETHAVLEALKTLAVAPLKTVLLLRRGRESTYAKKEATGLGSAYVALHWNPNMEDAAEQILAAVHDITIWMRGKRTAACPYLPTRKAENPASVSEANQENAYAELLKPKKQAMDFTSEVLKGKATSVRSFNAASKIVQRINANQTPGGDGQSEKLLKLAAQIRAKKQSPK